MVKEFHEIVGAILILETPLSIISLSGLLGISKNMIHIRLSQLHAVLNIPDNEAMPVRLFHLSFRDFLLDPETREKTEFWVDKEEAHQRLTEKCLTVMQGCLKKNICDLAGEGAHRMAIGPEVISHYIPPQLQYSCRYWTQHLAQCKDPMIMIQEASLFLQEHFLHWAEVMCIVGYASEIIRGIEMLQSVLKVCFLKVFFFFFFCI